MTEITPDFIEKALHAVIVRKKRDYLRRAVELGIITEAQSEQMFVLALTDLADVEKSWDQT